MPSMRSLGEWDGARPPRVRAVHEAVAACSQDEATPKTQVDEMNWRPASPFDACLANELVRKTMPSRSVIACVLHDGFGMRLESVGEHLGVSRERANQLRHVGMHKLRCGLLGGR
jgi:hypothetical protein